MQSAPLYIISSFCDLNVSQMKITGANRKQFSDEDFTHKGRNKAIQTNRILRATKHTIPHLNMIPSNEYVKM